VSETSWTGSGPKFGLSWGGLSWALELNAPNPGLECEDVRARLSLLTLEGLSRAGRVELGALSAQTLVRFECYRGSVWVFFAPPEWGGLTIRAALTPVPMAAGVDLEVQASAMSVGELAGVEVLVKSSYHSRGPARVVWASPRSETGGHLLPPRVWSPFGTEARAAYVELAHPNDTARRTTQQATEAGSSSICAATTWYALFGHDLERGVILRSRLRGCWIRSDSAEDEAQALYGDFLGEPPPLGG
jgi:hypothetical protein